MAERIDLSSDEVVAHLAATDLFSLLDPEALVLLAPVFRTVRYRPGQLIARQGAVDAGLWIVLQGQVSTDHRLEDGSISHMAFHGYAAVVGEAGVFTGEPRTTSAVTVEPTELLYADREDLWSVLGSEPEIFDRLVLDDAVRQRLEMFELAASLEGEYQVAVYRRHWIVLVQRMLMPLALLALSLLVAAGLAALSTAILSSPAVVLALAILGLGVPLLGAVWAYFDYHYDCLIVTNRRIIRIERTPFIDTARSEAFLTNIQDVHRVTPGMLARLLGYGTITVQTASSGGAMKFTKVAHPEQVRETIFEQADRAREQATRERQARIAQQVQRAISEVTSGETPPPPPARPTEVTSESAEGLAAVVIGVLIGSLAYFWPKTRTEERGVVTWRKHWWVLVRGLIIPLLLLVALGAMSAYAWWSWGTVPWLAVAPIAGLLVLWLVWRYEDWRNDLYQLTDDHIIDIERRPLGFFEERRQASLGQIQDVRYVVPNPVATALDIGNVVIETAAEVGNFTFDSVYHPAGVQQEIFARIDRYKMRTEADEERRRAEELSTWIATYHRLREGGGSQGIQAPNAASSSPAT
jgi:CRP-like cAMP-binding protein/membrane protein YdbS with pleckstrin-like domain